MIEIDVSLNMDTDNAESLTSYFKELIEDAVKEGFKSSQNLILKQSFDQGVLLRSGKMIKLNDLSWMIRYDAEHALAVEFGAEYTDKMPPLKQIHDWIKRKKIQPKNPESFGGIKAWMLKKGIINEVKSKDSDIWAMAFFVARDIKDHGLEARPYLRPAIEDLKRYVEMKGHYRGRA